ncbi:HD domain-containing protein [Candidatus Dojkabacteria bacterium]|nr:HD domain-containing protein [Candidatus Dojkabacteria bacterium]
MKYTLNDKYLDLWKAAFQYQDTRNDKGHAYIVSLYAQDICEQEKCNPDIVVPSAILHDIGWSKLPLEERMSVFKYGVPQKERTRIREKHQKESVSLARGILNDVGHEKEYVEEILEIVSQHDTRTGFISDNEGAMRDADKLWRFDDYGFLNDNQNSGLPFDIEISYLEKKLADEGFLYFNSTKAKAQQLLRNLKAKYLN